VIKSGVSKVTILKFDMSTLVAPLGGNAKVNLSFDLTFQNKFARAATKQAYRIA
jgi:hypothetical protein